MAFSSISSKACSDKVYQVHLECEEGPFGIQITGCGKIASLLIVSLQDSKVVPRWNKENPCCPIEVGMAIVEVNGMTEPTKMIEELKNSTVADLLIKTELDQLENAVLKAAMELQKKSDQLDRVLEEVTTCDVEPCSICHDDLDANCQVVRLPCGHHFHRKCVKKWLLSRASHSRCPLCNQVVEVP